ncbi:pyridine nucleotide-disulfide oxidoreductase, partial [Rhodococcus sp. H36-A4]|nr:pyridine nucleotide-disulfide oxidoreductase [Rhodococcus sp. H36-A4]
WIKRGPVGLIGHTKGDANETVANLLEDAPNFTAAPEPTEQAVVDFLESKKVPFTTWDGWYRLDAHERSLGETEGRERVKVVEREDMLKASEPDKA